MILYCDTSALLKLFIDEEGTDDMLKARADYNGLVVCRITWAEAMAAFAQARSHFVHSWPNFAIADLTQPLVEKAGVYAEAFALRGYDSVQLAAAHNLHEQFDLPLTFACFDRHLNQAAQLLQLEVLQ